MAEQRLRTKVEPHGKTATFFHIPEDVVGKLSDRKRVPVRVTVGEHTYRSTIAPMGGVFLLPLNRENRQAAGVSAGDEVTIVLARDDEPRTVDVPDDLQRALDADESVAETFDGLSYSHRKEYVEWITGAKRAETRHRRIERAVKLLREGTKSPH